MCVCSKLMYEFLLSFFFSEIDGLNFLILGLLYPLKSYRSPKSFWFFSSIYIYIEKLKIIYKFILK